MHAHQRLFGRAEHSASWPCTPATANPHAPPPFSLTLASPIPALKEAYSGPSPPCGTGMRRALARVEIEEYGLALTVAPSVSVPSGYGLFAELLPGVDEATVPAATPLTPLGGYGDGRLSNSLNEEHPSADRAVAFALSSEASVLHGGIFCQLNGLLAPGQHAGVTSRCGVVRAAARGETSAACTKVRSLARRLAATTMPHVPSPCRRSGPSGRTARDLSRHTRCTERQTARSRWIAGVRELRPHQSRFRPAQKEP